MKTSWIAGRALAPLILMAITAPAFADIPNPSNLNRKKSQEPAVKASMHIETDQKAKEAKLIIPRVLWQQMKAELDGTSAQTASDSTRFFNMTGAQTIMSGLFLSLAFAFGGVWLVRSRVSDRARTAALCVSLLLIGGVTTGIAYANAGPPPVARTLTSKILIPELQWWGAYGDVKVEIADEGDQIRLVLPRREITDKDRRQTD